MSGFDKALDKLIQLEMDPEAKDKAERRKLAGKAVIAKLQQPNIRSAQSEVISSDDLWKKPLKRARKKYGKNSPEYTRLLKSKENFMKAFEATAI